MRNISPERIERMVKIYQLAKGRVDYEAIIRKAIAMNDSDCKAYLASFIQNMDKARKLILAELQCHNH